MSATILIIDDSKTIRQQVLDILQQTSLFEGFLEAGDAIEGFKTVLSHSVDVVLCDLEMPGMDGGKLLGMLKGREDLRDIPVIMLTGRGDLDAKIRSLEQGASDYVTKPFEPGELVARVKVQLKIKSLQDSLKEKNQLLLELSQTDPLTGLSNRRAFTAGLEKELNRARRNNTPLSLVMIDIDHFKKVNDTYGHQQGDVVLRKVAEVVKGALRDYDLASRFGGEEFALVLPGTDCAHAFQAAERLRKAVSELPLDQIDPDFRITVSLGVGCLSSLEVKNMDDLIRSADDALYRAKRNGRNRVEVAPE